MSIKRRDFITLLGGAAACPLAARAQQTERTRRIGVLLPAAADDPEFQARVGAFLQGLQQSGWTIGRNVRIDTRWATTSVADIRRHAAELAALAPDVILPFGASTVGPLLQATRTVPIVFPVVGDPVGAGFVNSLAAGLRALLANPLERDDRLGGLWQGKCHGRASMKLLRSGGTLGPCLLNFQLTDLLMADGDRNHWRVRHRSKIGEAQPGDELNGTWSRERLEAMNAEFVAQVERAIRSGRERAPTSTVAESNSIN
jgi:hypothetical protein